MCLILPFAAATAVLFAQFAVAGRAEAMAPGAPAGALYEYGTLRSGARPQLLCTGGKVLVQNRAFAQVAHLNNLASAPQGYSEFLARLSAQKVAS